MISIEALPARAIQVFSIAKRFQKFLVVGSIRLLVNQVMVVALHDIADMRLVIASPVAILMSMAVTFSLNEIWTWHDRGSGPIVQRLGTYVPINSGGLVINWALLLYLAEHRGVHHLLANLIGAGIAAIWNFGLNNAITWRE
jgi:putative flippase GtrA